LAGTKAVKIMPLEEAAKYLKHENNGRPDCPDLRVYPNNLDINELSDIAERLKR